MAAAKTLSSVLPQPKYYGDHLGPSPIEDESSTETATVALKSTGPPPYGQRRDWIPRTLEDYGDGGAYPEINIVQYPLELGKKKTVCSIYIYGMDT
jgi:SNW domain-containing protein 1